MSEDQTTRSDDPPSVTEAELRRVLEEGAQETARGESVPFQTLKQDFAEALHRIAQARRAKRAS